LNWQGIDRFMVNSSYSTTARAMLTPDTSIKDENYCLKAFLKAMEWPHS
jgi:hypothetical protein